MSGAPSRFACPLALRFALAAFAGVLLGRCQHAGWEALAWVGMAPLCVALWGVGAGRAAVLSATTGATGALHLYGVATYGADVFVGLWAYVVASMAVLGALAGFALGRDAPGHRIRDALVPALAWTAAEHLRTLGPVSFPISLAATQVDHPLPLQVASLGGECLASLVVAWTGCAAAQVLCFRRRAGPAVALAAAALLAALAFGAVRLARAPSSAMPPRVPVAGVQAGAPPWLYRLAAFDRRYAGALASDYRDLTDDAVRHNAAAILWPEHALWGEAAGGALSDLAVAEARRAGRPLLVGSTRTLGPGRQMNSAFVVAPGGLPEVVHDKVHLAPLAEAAMSPGASLRPARLSAGPAALGPVGVLICLESLYPAYAREHARAGATWLAILTNDAGFLRSPIAELHARRAVTRAIETGRPVLRVAQSGVSMAVDPWGRVRARAAPFTRAVVVGDAAGAVDTPYLACGDAVAWACWVALLALGAVGVAVRPFRRGYG